MSVKLGLFLLLSASLLIQLVVAVGDDVHRESLSQFMLSYVHRISK